MSGISFLSESECVRLLADWRLVREVEEQMRSVVTGFAEIIPLTWLQFFDEKELEVYLNQD